MKGRGDGGYWHKKGREGEGAGAELAGRGTYTEVISTWPAPSPLSQPHRMAHTEKNRKKEINIKGKSDGEVVGGTWWRWWAERG